MGAPSTLQRRALAAAFLLAVAALPAAGRAADPAPRLLEDGRERWYVISIGDEPVGMVHDRTVAKDGGTESSSELRLVLNRLGSKVEMSFTGASRESADGHLLSSDLDTRLSAQATSQRAVVEPGKVRIEDRSGGQSFPRELTYTGELLGDEGIRRLSALRLRKPGDQAQFQTFSSELGAVVTVTRKVLAEETTQIGGKSVPVRKIEERADAMPAPRLLWLDGEGELVRSEDNGPFGALRTVLADEATARLAATQGGELPAEIYRGTLVRTPFRLPQPRRMARLVLELRHKNPALGWPDLSGPDQKVLARSDRTLILEITRALPAVPATRPVAETPENRDYLAPNALLQSNDPELAKTAAAVVGDERDVLKAGLALERWVAEHMAFDLGVVLAPAAEAFQSRRGTCASYAALLAAMARAVGIPSRYVMGMVYLDGIFGGHAWAEIQVGDQWVPLDGAVPADGVADAARFAFARTSLVDGLGTLANGAALQLFGQIDVRVLEYEVRGEAPHKVPAAAAKPYEVAGDLYRNPGLGISWKKPAGFRFIDLDAVWPESALVGLAGPRNQHATLERVDRRTWEDAAATLDRQLGNRVPGVALADTQVSGHAARRAVSDGRAALGWNDGLDVWILDVRGGEAPALLDRLAAGLKLE